MRQLRLQSGSSPALARNWNVKTLAGLAGASGFTNGNGVAARFNNPRLLSADASGNIYLADTYNHAVRLITANQGHFPVGVEEATPSGSPDPATLANSDGLIPVLGQTETVQRYIDYSGVLAPGETSAKKNWDFMVPKGVNAFSFRVRVEADAKLAAALPAVNAQETGGVGSPDVLVQTVAGSTTYGYTDATAPVARFSNYIYGLAQDDEGNLYIGDLNNNAVRRLSRNGIVSTIAGDSGNGTSGYANGNGKVARFSGIGSIVKDPHALAFYVADYLNCRIRRIELTGSDQADPSSWTVSTIAGTGSATYANGTGDTAGGFLYVHGLVIDPSGTVLYASEGGGHRIRKLQWQGGDPNVAANWKVSLLAGSNSTSNTPGMTDGMGAGAGFNLPTGLALGDDGAIYVADYGNSRIRKITPDGLVTTLAGSSNGMVDGIGSGAMFYNPIGLAIDRAGYLYVSDRSNNRIRRVSPAGEVRTVAGRSNVEEIDGPGDVACFNSSGEIIMDRDGSGLWVSDTTTIRRIDRIEGTGMGN
jgi:hypothetical protein